MSSRGTLLLALLLALAVPAAAAADEGQRVDAVVAATVRANYESLHGCYRKQLARDRSKGGSLILRITLGHNDAVSAAAVVEDRLRNSEVASCVLGWVRGWTLRGAASAGADEGSQVLLPITFHAVPDQFVVRREDAPEVALSGGSVRVLLSEKNAGARQASLSVVEVRGKLALPERAGVDQALYVLEGRGTLTSTVAPTRRLALQTGDAAWLPPEARVSAEGTMTLLQVVVPAGLEQFWRAKTPTPASSGSADAVRVVPRKSGRRRPALRGLLSVTSLLDAARLSHRRFYLGLLEAKAGTSLPEHQHRAEAELVYVLEGQADARCGESKKASVRVGPGEALHMAAGRLHSATVVAKLRAVQIFAPAGPYTAGHPR